MTPDVALQEAIKRFLFDHCAMEIRLPNEIRAALPVTANLIGLSRGHAVSHVLDRVAEVFLDVHIWSVVDDLSYVDALAIPIVSALMRVGTLTIEHWQASPLIVRSTRYFCERLGYRSVGHGTISVRAILTKMTGISSAPALRLFESA